MTLSAFTLVIVCSISSIIRQFTLTSFSIIFLQSLFGYIIGIITCVCSPKSESCLDAAKASCLHNVLVEFSGNFLRTRA